MNQHPEPKRAIPGSAPRHRRMLLSAGAGLAVAAIAGTSVLIAQNRVDAAVDPGRPTCAGSVQLVADPAWAKTLDGAADAYAESLGSDQGCTPVDVTTQNSDVTARDGLGDASGWAPEDTTSIASAKDPSLSRAGATRLGTTPLVLVNTPEAAAALKGPMAGETLRRMISLDDTWANHGHKEWGWFKLIVPTPNTTTTGAAGFASLMGQMGRGEQLPANPILATENQRNMAKTQQRIVGSADLADVTNQLAPNPADANGRTPAGPRTGITTLTLAMNSSTPVKASYLDGRTGITLNIVNPDNNGQLRQFTDWLQGQDGQAALNEQGLTTQNGIPNAQKVSDLGLPVTGPNVAELSVRDLQSTRKALEGLSRRASTLLVLDTSGSMKTPMSPGGPTRFEALAGLAMSSWSTWPPGMANGMITFNATDDKAMTPQIQTVIPLMRDTSQDWAKARPTFRGTLTKTKLTGGTPLYQAIATGWDYNTENYQTGMVNRMIVVTDGSDRDAKGALSYDDLMKRLPKQPDPERPIKVTYVALGPDADFKTLDKIAKATGQQAMQINSVDELRSKMAKLMTS